MTTINLGGVPEHFNMPIHLAIEQGLFDKRALHVAWKEFPDGTGAMVKALRNKNIDLAIILTEGITRDIIQGNNARILQNYVSSPLRWGVHVAAGSDFKRIDDLEGRRAAISRMGSGSHIMAYVQALEKGWDTQKLQLVEVGTLDKAVEALSNEEADYFMWEHFTTKPLVDRGIFRNLGDFPTPWSSFVIAGREEFITKNETLIKEFLKVVNAVTAQFKEVKNIAEDLAERYDQKLEDVQEWLSLTTWSQEQIKKKELDIVQKRLLELKMIDSRVENDFLTVQI